MSDESVDPRHREQWHHDTVDDALERRLEDALATAPVVDVPDDFAARVAARLPPAVVPHTHYARNAMLGCGVALLAVMFFLVAPTHRGTHGSDLLELLFSAELVIIALVSGPWRRGLGSGE